MQTCYDRVMVRPSGLELVSALTAAQEAANATPPALAVSHSEWMAVVAEARGRREGFREWNAKRYCDASGVGLVWWTDHGGRRHFRVLGMRWPLQGYAPKADLITRGHPTAWFFSGGRCFLVGAEWVVACACGEVGPPERVGWMGTACAACHDREQEGQPTPPRILVGAVPAEPEVRQEGPGPAYSIAVDDTRLLLTRDADDAVVLDYPFTHGWEPRPHQEGPQSYAFLSPDEESLVLVTPSVHVFRLVGGRWRLGWSPDEGDWPWAFSPAGELLVGASDVLGVYTREGTRMPSEAPPPPEPDLRVSCAEGGFAEGGRYIVALADLWHDDAEGVGTFRGRQVLVWERHGHGWRFFRQERVSDDRPPVMSDGGRWIGLPYQDPGVAFLDAITGYRSPNLAGDRFSSSLTFLADGETVILGTQSGLVYAPWRLLLGLGPP